MGRRGNIARTGWFAIAGAVSVLICAPSASATVTLGQIAAPTLMNTASEAVQPVVTTGNTYVVPGDGTIVSWSTIEPATGSPGKAKLKIYRKVANPGTYMVVAQDNFKDLVSNSTNTYNVTIPGVQAGDVIGMAVQGNTGFTFPAGFNNILAAPGDLPTGGQTDFTPVPSERLDVTAVLDPSHAFTIDSISQNKKKGIGKVAVDVPGPGQFVLSGNGVKGSGSPIAIGAKGPTAIQVKAKGSKLRKLLTTGKVTLNVGLTYTPAGGTPGTGSAKVKLRKKL